MSSQPRLLIVTVLLILSVTALAAVAYAQDSSPIYLPLIQGGSAAEQQAANASDLEDTSIIAELQETPVWDPTQMPPIEEQQHWIEEAIKHEPPNEIVIVGGPETRGQKILIAGKNVQLPADAESTGIIMTVGCIQGAPTPCPEPPLIGLRRGEWTIFVGINSGIIYEGSDSVDVTKLPEAEQIDYRESFRFLYDALDVPFPEETNK